MDQEPDQQRDVASASRVRPPDRYGDVRPPWHRHAARAAAVAGTTAAMAWVVWAGIGSADRDVRWSDVGFEVTGPSQVVVTFDVVKDPGTTATCRLEAMNARFAVIGVAEVKVAEADERAVRLARPVATQERAVTGVVKSCTVP